MSAQFQTSSNVQANCNLTKLRVALDFLSTVHAGLEQGLEVSFKGAAAHCANTTIMSLQAAVSLGVSKGSCHLRRSKLVEQQSNISVLSLICLQAQALRIDTSKHQMKAAELKRQLALNRLSRVVAEQVLKWLSCETLSCNLTSR